jgi:hypothetical protein
MTIVGLDLSLSGTGACRLTVDCGAPAFAPKPPLTALFGTSSKQTTSPRLPDERWEMERFGSTLNRVKNFIDGSVSARADLVVIEEFAFGVKGAGARSNAGFGYLVRYWLYAVAKIPFLLVGNAQLKKFAAGKASGKGADNKMHGTPKEVVIREIFNLWGAIIDNDNEADAFVLAKIGEALTAGFIPARNARAPVIAAQKAVLGELRTSNPWISTLEGTNGKETAAAGAGAAQIHSAG